ncbi:4-(cytidine 5'-diphospho)-2-C-methyl-D-erythritol kinase [Nocardioides mesophilus]|uniref:4-diphosphocytidyl-2-C-methyl-D-erythritol kinase n=1 Tax=Nocardioides mesophilus TaxID=433659 RepID=A0A7G9R7L3_9ACTN|nr:4-(cytidine 5'-diphospho)-2-C-methyl-D-erythritol kinase [Nocardioides mesophilus]QNN51588.1 4-(cytidine 5'-diphospho)-2-C-methyl-D-erythritol kinase [Nocardioides mesophilus]
MSATTGPGWVTASAPAKINLHLGVGRVRADGFHPLATVYQAIGLRDEVTVRPAPSYVVTVDGDERLPLDQVPADESNLAVRAAQLLARRHGVDEAVAVHISKNIPVAGGLAGGSADAAAALVACDALWELRLAREELVGLAAQLGSDVPFALLGGTAVGTGRGEVVVPAMAPGEYWWVVLGADFGLATPEVYRQFDALHASDQVAEPAIPEPLMEALRSHDVLRLGHTLRNDLETPAVTLHPEIEEMLGAGLAGTAVAALLSGSGPSCLFLCDGSGHAHYVAGELAERGYGPVVVTSGPVPGARVERIGGPR